MKIDELTEEMLEEAKKCKTFEARRKFIEDNKIELSPDLLDGVTGGTSGIDTGCEHEWVFIYRQRGYNLIYECRLCGDIKIECDD